MTSIESKLEKNYLQCSICCDQFVTPRVLNCQHSFCHRCLEGCLKASKTNLIKCAICRKKTVVPQKGVREIPQNFMIVSLLQMLKDSKHDQQRRATDKAGTSKGKSKAAPARAKTTAFKAKTAKPKTSASNAKTHKASGATKVTTLEKQKSKKAQLKAKDENDNKKCVQSIKSKPATKAATNVKCCKEKNGTKKTCQKSKSFKIEFRRYESSSSSEDSYGEFTPDDDSSSSSSNCDSVTDSDSSEFDSDSDSSDDSSYSDSSYEVLSERESQLNSEDESESYSDDDCPPTPHLQSFMGINVTDKVLIFTEKGQICKGVVRVLEKFKRKPLCLSAVYAGVQLMEHSDGLMNTGDLHRDMQDSYLFSWINNYHQPCAVVRADQCCPTSFYNSVSLK